MADYVQEYSDRQLAALERRIGRVYAQAAREIRRVLESFNAGHAARSAQMLRDVKSGKITQKDYQDWLRGQVYQGRLWEEKLDEVTRVYQSADREARRMVGDTDKTVFAEAANYQAYQTERAVGGGVSFSLYDRSTVDRLVRDRPQMLPEWRIDEPKDYRWNAARVQNAVTQGILQGESVQQIGHRLTGELAAKNAGKMEMFARTAVTGAQNAGRVERMREAEEEYGIKSQKRWLSAHDDRVRDTHDELDGQTVDADEPFVLSDGRTIEYPGDPHADADLVYNCRCTLLYIPTSGPHGDYSLDAHRLPEYDAYNDWKAGKR